MKKYVLGILLALLVITTMSCGSRKDADRYVRGEFPGYDILVSPGPYDPFNGDIYVLCHQTLGNAIVVHLKVRPFDNINGATKDETNDVSSIQCGEPSTKSRLAVEKVKRIGEIVDLPTSNFNLPPPTISRHLSNYPSNALK